MAKKRGGKCLSRHYINSHSKLRWQCAEEHKWEAISANIQQGQWCPYCAGFHSYSIERMREIAEKRGGKCLSKKCVNSYSKLRWQCAEGHEWEATTAHIKNHGSWCPECGHKRTADKRRGSIEEMQKLAKSRGGKCLSKEYVNKKAKLRWRCAEGHEWETSPDNIQSGCWCSQCYYKRSADERRGSIEEMQKLAKSRGGKCLSEEYMNSGTKLRWRCAEGHKWEATASNVKDKGSWCPICSSSLGERICREYFEQIFNKSFPAVFPKWLRNKEGFLLQLDGYCESLGLAFEHQGTQHYRQISFFHTNSNSYKKRVRDDRLKRRICRNRGVVMIEIPQIGSQNFPLDKVQSFIIKECKARGVTIPLAAEKKNIDINRVYRIPIAIARMRELQELARSRGGKCLSKEYVNNHTKLRWMCAEGHEWEAVPSSIMQSSWCPKCAGKAPLSIEEMQKLAKSRGGKCLSKEYVNNHTKLRWMCAEGHEWEAVPSSIMQSSWCPKCGNKRSADKRRGSIEEMQKLAKSRGGKCLSEEYIDANTRLRWRCAEGHEWMTTASSVKNNGSWCLWCARKKGGS